MTKRKGDMGVRLQLLYPTVMRMDEKGKLKPYNNYGYNWLIYWLDKVCKDSQYKIINIVNYANKDKYSISSKHLINLIWLNNEHSFNEMRFMDGVDDRLGKLIENGKYIFQPEIPYNGGNWIKVVDKNSAINYHEIFIKQHYKSIRKRNRWLRSLQ